MQLYRLTYTVTEYGHDPANGVAFAEGFAVAHPEVGASVSQNLADGTLSITFSLDADSLEDAVERGREVFGKGAASSGLDPTEVIDLSVRLAASEDHERQRELQPA